MKIRLNKLPVIGPYLKRRQDPKARVAQCLTKPEGRLVQIGSNIGLDDTVSNLLQLRPNWHAIFVEPVPYVFAQLKRNYGESPRFIFENKAINQGREQIFYSVDESAKEKLPNLPGRWHMLGSFNKGHITKHLPELEPFVRETIVHSCTLTTLLETHRVDHFDFLNIDTEGYDWNILQQLDLNRWKPEVILFEHKHLNADELKAAKAFLKPFYKTTMLKSDCLCRLR